MNTIIACVDRENELPTLCDHATWAAKRLGSGLEFLHVIDHHPERAERIDASGSIGLGAQDVLLDELARIDAQRSKLALDRGRLLLDAAKARANEASTLAAEPRVHPITSRQRHGHLVDALNALESGVQLVVMAQHHHPGDLSKRHLDHNLERVIRGLHRPVLVAGPQFAEPRGYLLAFDGSSSARRVVQAVAASELLNGLVAHIVTVGSDSKVARDQLAWAAESLHTSAAAPVTSVIAGEPETALAGYAREHELTLLVIGAYGHSRIRHLIVGSTTTTILRTSAMAVLVMR